ncbi:MAG TPA: hypothetical protein VE996_09005 [Terriglobales bacterium]|nr:hypothetical protein [Terriglobales bacterium]
MSASPISRPPSPAAARLAGSAGFAAAALAAGGGVFGWALARGRLLLYGDATAHLMIARRMFDSLTPGLSQWGSVWLPLPHLLMAPFVAFLPLWRSGAAGSIVSLAAFALAAAFVHRIAARAFGAGAARWAALFFLLNPNLLYLAAVPMTETVYLAAFLGAVDQIGRYQETGARRHAVCAGLWALAGSMTRYDGWFCLPFFALALWHCERRRAGERRWWRMPAARAFCAVAAIGPVFWFAYNAFYFRDWLAFLRGPYSARQIYLNALRHGGFRYPGDHQLAPAVLYYLKCAALDCGTPLLILAALGLAAWFWRSRRSAGFGAAGDRYLPAFLLLLPLPWYIWAMWSGNVPIFVPMYWPHGYYNLRYGVQVLPAAAVWSGAFVLRLGGRWARPARHGVAIGLAALVALSYAAMLRGEGPMTYAEAVHNAPARLAMEHKLAAALAPRRRGERVLMFLGTYPGALADDGIALRAVIQESNFRIWERALEQPQQYAAWVVVQQGTSMDQRVNHAALARYFQPVARFTAPQQAPVTVYRRRSGVAAAAARS